MIVEWRESDGHVLMAGPVEVEFTGRLPDSVSPEPALPARRGDSQVAANDYGASMDYDDRHSGAPDPFRRA